MTGGLRSFMSATSRESGPLTIAQLFETMQEVYRRTPPETPYRLYVKKNVRAQMRWFMFGQGIIRADLMRKTAGMRRRQARAQAGKRHRHG